LASKLEAAGDARSAQGIRKTLQKGKSRDVSVAHLTPAVPVDSESRLGLADEQTYRRGEVRLFLDASSQLRVNEFLRFVRGSTELIEGGVGVASSLLAYGPPGCGKTELAKYLAAELELPLLTARTDTLISSYLGSTAKNLRLLFEHAMARPCVLFLDEFDAVAKLRDDQHELGELKRVVVSLLQNIDALDPHTVLIAATNHQHLLDLAIWRRFAFRLEIGLPNPETRQAMFGEFLGTHASPDLGLEMLAGASEGMSGAAIRQLCEDSRRHAILSRQAKVTPNEFLIRFAHSRVVGLDAMSLSERLRAVRHVSSKLFTVRRLSAMFAVSIGKVSTLLNEERGP
jgi:SpoVK/Ycf46/Vps4 family AAA+-type ATPase